MPTQRTSVTISTTKRAIGLRLANGVQLQFALDQGRLLGLSQAVVDGLQLIAPGSPRLPYAETRDGWQISEFRFRRVRRAGAGCVIECEAWAIKPPVQHRIDMYQFMYLTTPHRAPVKLGTLQWMIQPVTRTLGHAAVRQHTYHGFTYQYRLRLQRGFHWLLDAGTWELGGDPEGVTVFAPHADPDAGAFEATISRDLPFWTTADTFKAGAYGANILGVQNTASAKLDALSKVPQDVSVNYCQAMQSQVRGTCGPLIDFQYKPAAGLLLGYLEQPGYYRNLTEWRADDPGIGHLDNHFFALTIDHTTPAHTILAAAAPGLTRADALNRWTDAYDHVANAWRTTLGLRHHAPKTGLTIDNCGTGYVDIGFGPKNYLRQWTGRLDWVADQGFEYVFVGPIGDNHGLHRPYEGNACVPYDYGVAKHNGGPAAFRELCAKAHARGLEVAVWLGPHLSQFAPVWKEHPEWKVYDDTKHELYDVCRVASLRRGFGDWLLAQFLELKKLGLDMIFFDSYPNMGATVIDYGDPTLDTRVDDLWQFQRRCDDAGFPIQAEGIGPLGVSSLGYARQWYGSSPELAYWTGFRAAASDFETGVIDEAHWFEMMANKAPLGWWVVDYFHKPFKQPPQFTPRLIAMQQLYNRLSPIMQVRTLHDDGTVEWLNPETGEGCLFVVGKGSLTVPAGCRAEPVFGTKRSYGSGTHACRGQAAFLLHRQPT